MSCMHHTVIRLRGDGPDWTNDWKCAECDARFVEGSRLDAELGVSRSLARSLADAESRLDSCREALRAVHMNFDGSGRYEHMRDRVKALAFDDPGEGAAVVERRETK